MTDKDPNLAGERDDVGNKPVQENHDNRQPQKKRPLVKPILLPGDYRSIVV